MKRATTWVLTAVAVVGLALAAAADFAHFHAPGAPWRFAGDRDRLCAAADPARAAAECAPAGGFSPRFGRHRRAGRRALLFPVRPQADDRQERDQRRLRAEADDGGGRAGEVERWPPQLEAIGTLRAYQGIVVAPQAAGVVSAIHFESGDDVAAGAPLVDLDTSVEVADLANGLAQLKNANVTLDRARALIANGNTPQSTVDAALAARDSAAASVEHTRRRDRPEGDQGAGRRAARPAQRRSRPVCRRRRRSDPAAAARPDLCRFLRAWEALATLAVGQEATLSVDASPAASSPAR